MMKDNKPDIRKIKYTDMDDMQYLILEQALYDYAETLCSGSNTQKRLITDVAISKIPYVVYPDLDIEQSLVVHELGEYLMREAKERNNSDEVLATYDLVNGLSVEDGMSKIIEKTGICFGTENTTTPNSDSLTMSLLRRAKDMTIVSMHNHPSCSPFSIDDISAFTKEYGIKLMVVIGNNGELYYMSKKKDYDYIAARRYLNDAIKAIIPNIYPGYRYTASEARAMADLFLYNCHLYNIEYKHVLGTDRNLEKIKIDKFSAGKEESDIEEEEDYGER